jgi:hypothetical protein
MVPRTLLRPLSRLRWKERFLRLLWGMARVLVVVAVFLAGCCTVDWLVDRYTEDGTPHALLRFLLGGQALIAAVALALLVARPLFVRLSNARVALWAETAWPAFRHRLISAVELNRPNAPTAGMSPSLIAQVTREAEAEVRRADLRKAVDRSRYWKSGVVVAPVLLGALIVLLVMPDTALALLKRQFLGNAEIPRSVYLASVTEDVWPENDAGTIKLAAKGYGVRDDLEGKVFVRNIKGSTAELELRYSEKETEALREKEAKKGQPSGRKVFVARVAPGTEAFTFGARLKDGRLKTPGRVVYEPRPDVAEVEAGVSLPGHFARRPSTIWWKPGPLYVEPQSNTAIQAFAGAKIDLKVAFTKPVRQATLELLGPADDDRGTASKVVQTLPVELNAAADGGSVSFEMEETVNGYRFAMTDMRGFDNNSRDPWPLTLRKAGRPLVRLLDEVYRPGNVITGSVRNYVKNGEPWFYAAPGRLLVAYHVQSDIPVDRAWLRYRVVRGNENVQLPSNETEEALWLCWPPRVQPWAPPQKGELTLTEWQTDRRSPGYVLDSRASYEHPQDDPTVGPFITEEGVFARTANSRSIDFHAVPSDDPEHRPGRLEGGGRIHLPVQQLSRPVRRENGWREDESGRLEVGLDPGDRLVYYVEVSNRQDPPLIGRSELRETAMVTADKYREQLRNNKELDRRVKDFQELQDLIFDRRRPWWKAQ